MTQITGFFNRLIIRAVRYQESPRVTWSQITSCVISIPTLPTLGTRGEGTEFSNLNLLYGHRIQLPLTLFEFQSNDASPFFSATDGLPSPDGGDHVTMPGPRGQLVTQAGDHCTLLHCW